MSTRIASLIAASALATALTACGGGSFAGGSQKTQADQSAGNAQRSATATSANAQAATGGAQGQGEVAGPASSDLTVPEGASPEQEAIGKCLAHWGKSAPFDASVYQNYRRIDASVSIFGGGSSYAVEDTDQTDQPALIVVAAAVSVLGQTRYALMNPNGWYCIMADVNVHSSTEVDLQCKAHLTGSKVTVNVGSDAEQVGGVGVNVFSDVKVKRMPSEDSTSGC